MKLSTYSNSVSLASLASLASLRCSRSSLRNSFRVAPQLILPQLVFLVAGFLFPLFPFLHTERLMLAQSEVQSVQTVQSDDPRDIRDERDARDARDEATDAVTTTETTTSAGTISDFEPDTIVIRGDRSTEPLRYSYSKTTTFVDENGTPVSREVVKSGVPVTVYYAREGDRLIASKVVVRRTTTTEPERVIEKKTTTTTTDK